MSNWYKDGVLVSVKWFGNRVSVGDKVTLTYLAGEMVTGIITGFNTFDCLLDVNDTCRRLYCAGVTDVKILEKNTNSVLT